MPGTSHLYINPRVQRVLSGAVMLLIAAWLAGCAGETLEEDQNGNPPAGATPTSTPTANPSASPTATPTPFSAAPVQARILLSYQYKNAVGDLLGNAARDAVKPLNDTLVNGSSAVAAASFSLSNAAVESFEANAYAAAQAGLADSGQRAKLITCTPANATDDACLTAVVNNFGRRAFRRALTADELAAYKKVAVAAGQAYSSFDRAAEFAFAAMLQSPQFLYISEQGETDAQKPGMVKYTSTEMASRLSFFLLGTLPPESLLQAASQNKLATADDVRAQARALLDLPTAQGALDQLYAEWLGLNELSKAGKDSSLYPTFNPQIAQAMKQETLMVMNAIANDTKRSFLDFLDADFTFLDKSLAAYYNLPAPATDTFTRTALPTNSERAGVLTQGGFLAVMAHPVETSPTLRGKMVRERLLCEAVGAAPPDVVTELAPVEGSTATQTLRQRLVAHRDNPRCAGCHSLMDPIGFGFEKFDASGRLRTTDRNLPIDASGSLDSKGSFNNARELVKLLKADTRVGNCVTRVVFRHASGHVETEGELPALQQALASARAQGFTMRSILVELVASDAFRYGKR
jgi:hypothetical protein